MSQVSLLEEEPPAHRIPIPGVREALDRQRSKRGGRVYATLSWLGALAFGSVLITLVVSLVAGASQAFAHSGLRFFVSGTWDQAHGAYGAGVFVVGTLLTTFIALLIAVPIGVAGAAYLAEIAPASVAGPVGGLIEFIAAVPSIVVGLWGLLVLVPLFSNHVDPFLSRLPGLKVVFRLPVTAAGTNFLLAGVVLAVMILPTVVALTRTALRGVATADREAAVALGATRWQVTRKAVLPSARSGIEAAVTLATGRALGETIAVAMVVGNIYALPKSVGSALLSPGSTLGSAVINLFQGANPGLDRSAVIGLVVYLLAISAAVNVAGQVLLRRRGRRRAQLALP